MNHANRLFENVSSLSSLAFFFCLKVPVGRSSGRPDHRTDVIG